MKKLLICVVISLLSWPSIGQAPTFTWAKSMGATGFDYGYSIATDVTGNVYTAGQFMGTVDFDPGAGTFNLTAVGSIDIFISKFDASGNFLWAKSMGGSGNDAGYALATDATGNVCITGEFQGTVDFDPGPSTFNLTSSGGYEIFICKLNASGNFKWAGRIGASGFNDAGRAIGIDASGNVITVGEFGTTADFNPGAGIFNLTSAGSSDIFISKLDSVGNFIWANRIGGTDTENVSGLKVDASGNVYTTGDFKLTVDFDPGSGTFNLTTTTTSAAFISKLDATGNFVWAKQFSTGSFGHAIGLDNSNNVYSTGYYGGTVDFDPGTGTFNLTSSGGNEIYVSKLDASGNFTWAKKFSTATSDKCNSLAVDISGNVYTTGYFSGPVDFDPGLSTFNLTGVGAYDIFISKLDASGNFVWAHQLTSTVGEVGRGISVDPLSNLYITGSFDGTIDFDPGAATYNLTPSGSDIFVLKLSDCPHLSTPSSITGSASVCPGTTQLYSVTNDPSATSYSWTLPSGWSGTSASNSITVTTGTSGGTISVTANNVCGSSSSSMLTISMDNIPASPGTISGTTTVCSGSSNTYSITAVPGATSYTWTLPSGWSGTSTSNSISTTAGTTGGTISVTANNVCGSSASSTLTVSVDNIPVTPGTISGITTICSGSSNTYSISAVPGATSYTWTLPSGWSGTSTTTSINTTASTTGGNITVTANNACGNSSPQTLAITINTIPPTPGSISGATTVCEGSSNTYSVTAVPGATTYTWTLPSGWGGTSTTNSINTTASLTSGNITVTADNSCGSSASSNLMISVNTIPSIPSSITGSTSFCEDAISQTYSVINDASATSYTWTLPAGWGGASLTNAITATADGSGGLVSVTANNVCGFSTPQTLAVTVNPLPSVSFSITTDTICVDDLPLALTGGSPTGGTFSGTGVSGATFDPVTAGTGSHLITYLFTDANSCSNTATDSILVDLCLGLEQNSLENIVKIYPNPFSSTFIVAVKLINVNIDVFDALGNKINSSLQINQPIEINLEMATSGVYLVRITGENETFVYKIVKH